MKKSILIIVLIFSSSLFVFSQTTLLKGIFSIGGASGFSVVQTADSGYVTTGWTDTYGAGSYDVYIVKLDKAGNLEWTKTIGGTNLDIGYSIIQCRDKGYAIAAATNSFGAGSNDAYIIKLDSLGNEKWTKTIGGSNIDGANSIVQTGDGGYAITGSTLSFGAGGYDVYVIRLDSSGNLKWTKAIGGLNDDYGFSIVQTHDKGFAITGCSDSYGTGGFDVYVIKLDSSGNKMWTRTIGGPVDDIAFSIIQTADMGYAIAGNTDSYGIGVRDVYVIKLDSAGNLDWTRTIGDTLSNDEAFSIVQTKDKGYAIAAWSDYYNIGSQAVYFVRLDSNGNLRWTRSLSNEGNAIIQTKDEGFAITGNDGNGDMSFLKFDSLGNICDSTLKGGVADSGGSITSSDSGRVSSGGLITSSDSGRISSGGILSILCGPSGIKTITSPRNEINLSPNPCSITLNIDFENLSNLSSIQIMDITGRVLYTSTLSHIPNPLFLNVSTLSPGMYFIRINTTTGTDVKKFIKE